ncbi:MAG TPA: Tex family protein [bacterium]|nr:Tex family protein [bacterium]HMW34874.1 Tex family protein [bacterium]HMY34594.1 Tex family protein [bacterium]HMZ03028.1 Tex family protein [bacterium]HNB08202.1 Tex family protein [bacterium]
MSEQEILRLVAKELNIPVQHVTSTIQLLDLENTVPFIARYRKEVTGGMDENQIRDIQDKMTYYRALEARKEVVLKSIEEQGKLTDELKARIVAATMLQEVEDLYLPYKPKRRTKGIIAKEKGLEPLALQILAQEITSGTLDEHAQPFINLEKGVTTVDEALQGARDIIAEIISEDADVRKDVREFTRENGILVSEVKEDPENEYEMYHTFSEPIAKMPPHRILATNRGEREEKLRIKITVDEEACCNIIGYRHVKKQKSIFRDQVIEAIKESYFRLIAPSIEREIRGEFTEKSEEHAIEVFGSNARNLLLQAPTKGKIIMGIDPGFRTGCKVAVIDETGKYLEGETIYPHEPQKDALGSKRVLKQFIRKYEVSVIAIGNGTASRETESLVADLIADLKKEDSHLELVYTIVSEAGASVYSASKIAQQEFPDLEASQRGNISIARRLLDPLAELVKIDPKSIGVGQYQHDVNQKRLAEQLTHVVESAVNYVGVNLNTASAALLTYVSGLSSKTAQSIIAHRDKNGKFSRREQLMDVTGIGPAAYQQCAGFLRIPDGDNPLDNTSIHPESYDATQKLLKKFNIVDPSTAGSLLELQLRNAKMSFENIAGEVGVGVPTLKDILDNLKKPGRDPREEMPKPIFKSDVLKMEDLREGMMLKGTVRNVVDFGAFVDIGVKQDGLVHISHLSNKYVKNPMEVVAVGDVVDVKVMSVDLKKGRVQLSMKEASRSY